MASAPKLIRRFEQAGLEVGNRMRLCGPQHALGILEQPAARTAWRLAAQSISASLAAGTSTGAMRGQAPGRIGDSPLLGAGTWAGELVAISCTGDGEAFIRAGVARHIATLVAGGSALEHATAEALREVAGLGGHGDLIALDARGNIAMPFNSGAMPRASWRAGREPAVWV